MWVCKKCKHENKEYVVYCEKCKKDRTYPPNYSRYFAMTLILSAILMPTILLFGLYEWLPTIGIGGTIYIIYYMCFINGDLMETHELLAFLSSIILSIALAYLAYESKEYVNINLYTILSGIIAFSSLPALIIYFMHEEKKEKIALEKAIEEEKTDRKKRQELDAQRKREEIKKYGHPTRIINSSGRYSPLVRVFGKTEFIEICGSKIRFEDIVDYGVFEDITTDLHMFKPSMYGRGLIGGLLFGKLGAIAGVLTAKQYEETRILYTIHIWLNNGSERLVRTEDAYCVDKLCGVLESIVCQNMNRF